MFQLDAHIQKPAVDFSGRLVGGLQRNLLFRVICQRSIKASLTIPAQVISKAPSSFSETNEREHVKTSMLEPFKMCEPHFKHIKANNNNYFSPSNPGDYLYL